jgi:hypothetical protein
MKIIKEKVNKKGKREVVIELDQGEHIQAINPDSFYRTGYPVEDVVRGHVILDSQHVTWCSLGQEWVS